MIRIVFFLLISISLFGNSLEQKIDKYSGKNGEQLKKLQSEVKNDEKVSSAISFLLENMAPNDIGTITAEYLLTNVKSALESRKLEFNNYYDDAIFRHFVLPYRVSQEPLEDYRDNFYKELFPIVKDCKNVEEAVVLVNLWINEKLHFKYTSGRDAGPLTCIRHGWGRCEEYMILFIAAARSVGIPARTVSAPFWNFTDNNHAWVEVYTPEGWKYLGDDNILNDNWVGHTARRATLITSEAFGDYKSDETVQSKNGATLLSSIKNYTFEKKCSIHVFDVNNKPLSDAKVTIYGASYGGLFPMLNTESDENGNVTVPMGTGTVYITASKDGKIAGGVLDMMNSENPELSLKLLNNKLEIQDFNFMFPMPEELKKEFPKSKYHFEDKFSLMKKLMERTRDFDQLKNRKSLRFLEYYEILYKDKPYDQKKEFMEKCDNLHLASDDYLKLFDEIKDDSLSLKILINKILVSSTKDLTEIPNYNKIKDDLYVLKNGFERFSKNYTDSIFIKNVITSGSPSLAIAKNGWELEFSKKLLSVLDKDISKSAEKIKKWVDENLKEDEDYEWSYFSGAINPLNILNIVNVPKGYMTKVLWEGLRLSGIPVRWEGRIEYYDGKEFKAFENNESKKDVKEEKPELLVNVSVDGVDVKAEPFANFLILSDDGGSLYYTYFDGEPKENSFASYYLKKENINYYLIGSTRNDNGDANLKIIPLTGDEKEVKIELTTPKVHTDQSTTFSEETIAKVKDMTKGMEGKKIVIVRGETKIEPEIRMIDHVFNRMESFKKNNVKIAVYSTDRDNKDLLERESSLVSLTGSSIAPEISYLNYPLIFLLDENNELIFSYKGYNMGIGQLLETKTKK
ncbi:MAG: transglutaminase domain-containing protein [Candidatus Delongbacteria bacterium]|nr:transglutaminase domain-containing protein [Candidatus Delongbacteria bacterium]MBN2835993.1 transglutaminase domain-containing protein [Candidatus Delongbacteria bacterium]